jgi:hypothetical protein
MLFAWVYSSPPLSPSAGNESHLLALIWESKSLNHRGRRGLQRSDEQGFSLCFSVFSVSSVVKNLRS